MCGIAGIYNLNKEPVNKNLVQSMMNSLAHRGPDDEGLWLTGNAGLGHRRLSILDLSAHGKQPMISKNKEWVVVFNGCIYNFRELKEELIKSGHIFTSNSDTEVIVEGLAEHGVDYFIKFNGMFAIGAYNTKTNELFLSRDRYGIKPLYYCFTGNSFLFASEIKAFLKHPDFKVELNFSSLNEYFTFQNLFSYQTLFNGVYILPQANTVKINTSTKEVIHKSWWDYDFSNPDYTISYDDARTRTKELLQNAVHRQIVSDVPVGSYLSGGMDSGSITSAATGFIPRLTTFTCGFDMSDVTGVEANYDERRDAELMSYYFKTEHYEQVINAGDLSWSLPKVVWHLEDLRAGMSYPNYYISRLASKFVKVCLQGTGGDELFGGYPWRYYRVFRSMDQKEFFNNYYEFWQRLVHDNEKKNLFTRNVYKEIDTNEPRRIFERVFTFNKNLNYDTPEEHIQNSLYFEIKTFLHGLLIVGDKLSMASGLEERYPFLDNEFVNFAQKVPVKYKLANLEKMKKIDENEFRDKRKLYTEYDDGKNILRDAMRDFIPEKILMRKKQGFSAPDESWYRGENAKYIKDLLLNNSTVSGEFINRKYTERILGEHFEQKRNHRLLIWSLMNFEWWCRIFINNERSLF